MIKNNKANPKSEVKSNKIIKKAGGENPKKKKQQLEKVKKSIKKDLVEKDIPEMELDEVEELPVVKKQGGILKDAPDASEQSEAQSEEEADSETQNGEEESETEECTEGIGQTVLCISLQPETTRTELASVFAPCGKIMFILFTKELNAYIVLDSVEAADKAVKMNGTILKGQKLIVVKPKEGQTFSEQVSHRKNTVFVTNLDPKSNKNDIRDLFSSCGKIANVKILKKPVGKYSAFVCFRNSPEAVELALKIDGNMFNDNPIKVLPYISKPNGKFRSKVPFKGGFKGKKVFKDNKTKGETNTEFRGVKSGGIKKAPKAPKKKPTKIDSQE